MNALITAVPTDPTEALAPPALALVPGRAPAGDFDLLIVLLQASLAAPRVPAAGPPASVVASGTATPAAPSAAGASPAAPAGGPSPTALAAAGASPGVAAGIATATDAVATEPALTVETPPPSLIATPLHRAPRPTSPDEAALTGVDTLETREPDADEDGQLLLPAAVPASLVLTLAPAPTPGPTPGMAPSPAPDAASTAPAITTGSGERAADLAPAVAPLATAAAPRPTGVPAEALPQTNGAAPQDARPAAVDEAAMLPLATESGAIRAAKTPALASAELTTEADALGAPVLAPVEESRPRPVTRRVEPVRIGEGSAASDRATDPVVQRLTAAMASRGARGDGSRDDLSGFAPRPSRDDGAAVAPASEGAVAGVSAPTASLTPRAAVEDIESVRPAPLHDPVDQVATRLRDVRSQGRHEISLRLDPPDLGAVRIDARLEGARLHLQIRAEHAPTGELLADALPRLRESLVQQGFVPADVSVHLGLDGSGRQSARDGAPTFTPSRDDESSPQPRVVPAAARAVASSDGLDVWA